MAGAPLEASVTEFGAGALWAIFQALALAVPHAFQVGDFRLLVFVTAEREREETKSHANLILYRALATVPRLALYSLSSPEENEEGGKTHNLCWKFVFLGNPSSAFFKL